MCGIAGFISKVKIDANGVVQRMTQKLLHRGPDALAFYQGDFVAFGHARLSIIDLDQRANQPFSSKDGRYVMVYNGEIYNFRKLKEQLIHQGLEFRTQSDTEVLLEAFINWGIGFVHQLEGMFAFVIYDSFTKRTYLFRDRVGKKPLFYFQSSELLVFGSEIKAVLQHPAVSANTRVDTSTLSQFLQLGYVPQPHTFYTNVHKFPAGHYGILDAEIRLAVLPYWNVAHYLVTDRQISLSEASNQLDDLITQSVQKRLVADVPVGVFLSGGIDSSLVAAKASKFQPIKTFSIGFADSQFDESVHAEKVANYLGTEHYRYQIKEQDAVELLDTYLDHFDEPFADTSAIPTMLVSRLARQEVKVALTGDGGDELFLGYGSYTWANRLDSPLWQGFRPLIFSLMRLVPNNRWKRASHLLAPVRPGKIRRHIFSQEQYLFSDEEVREHVFSNSDYYMDWDYDDFRHLKILSEAERQALFDFQYYLRDDLLVKVDRASMYYGLECRSPLLDQHLIEFAINLPEKFKKKGGITKYLLKQILYRNIPSNYFNRPKWGFSVPLAKWLQSDLHYLVDSHLSKSKLEEVGVLNVDYARNLVHRFEKGEVYLYNRIWCMIIVQYFLSRKPSSL